MRLAARVTYKATEVDAMEIGDTLVIQGAIIRENGSHKRTVTGIKERATGRTLLFDNGTKNFYRSGTMLCKGIRF